MSVHAMSDRDLLQYLKRIDYRKHERNLREMEREWEREQDIVDELLARGYPKDAIPKVLARIDT